MGYVLVLAINVAIEYISYHLVEWLHASHLKMESTGTLPSSEFQWLDNM